MLLRTYVHLKPSGLFFIVLPLRCLTKSKYMDKTLLIQMLRDLGFELLKSESSPKIIFMCLRKKAAEAPSATGKALSRGSWDKLQKYCRTPPAIHRGHKRNNGFSIALSKVLLNCNFKGDGAAQAASEGKR